MHKTFLYLIIGIVGLFLSLMPQNAIAAELSFKTVPNTVTSDKATIVEVHIDPQSKNLNVIEGIIKFQGKISDKLKIGVETGGSALTLWPTPPQYSQTEKVIRFAGGVPKGFEHEGLLFRMRLSSSVSGNVTISWIGGMAYQNDGKGTEDVISARSVSVNLEGQNLEAIGKSSPDNTPPNFDFVEIGRDPSVYDGKYFISFHATDDVSGVAKYEVKEGQVTTTVTDGIYIFKNQDRTERIMITAYDQAGNSETIKVPGRYDWVIYVIILLMVIIVIFYRSRYVYKKIIKK